MYEGGGKRQDAPTHMMSHGRGGGGKRQKRNPTTCRTEGGKRQDAPTHMMSHGMGAGGKRQDPSRAKMSHEMPVFT